MFIKLTRKDGSPIWLNAGFIVTVEPLRGGGAVVVPIGDGLDYDVRESPETVLALLDGAPAPAVVPVPTSDALTATPEDVSPDAPEPAPAPETPADEGKTPKRTRKTPRAKESSVEKQVKTRAKTRKTAVTLTLTDEEVERLKKLAPKTVKKLMNTLAAQFSVTDSETVLRALEAQAILTVAENRVIWPGAEPPPESTDASADV